MSDFDFDELVEDLKQKRDELRVQMNLASRELRDEWEELEEKSRHFMEQAELAETGEGIGHALKDLGGELKKGYQRIRDAIKD
jgi:hypothetical protein